MPVRNRAFESELLSDHESKNFSMLELIRRNGPITRADISKVTGLNIVTVSNYINAYIEKGLIIEGGMEASSGGRKPTLIKLNERHGFSIGIDLGNMEIDPALMTGLVTDLSGKIIARVEKARPKETMDKVLAMSVGFIGEIMNKKEIDKAKVKGVGICVGGIIDETLGTVRDSTRHGMRTSFQPIKDAIKEKFNIPTFIGNDATFAAFGEKMHSLPLDVENVIYMYSDVGSGIILKGNIYCGASGSAGEMSINWPQTQTEEYLRVSKNLSFLLPMGLDLGLVNQAKKIINEGGCISSITNSSGNMDNLTVDDIINAAKSGDELATGLLEDAAINLGLRVSYLVNLFNPEIVIVGGGIEKAGSLFLEPLRRAVRKWAFEEPANIVKIIPSQLGKDAVALGGASIVIRNVFIQA